MISNFDNECSTARARIRPLHALHKVVSAFPKSSPDLNAIEGWWKRLRQQLIETEPEAFEDLAAFVARLRRVVTWLNTHEGGYALTLCTNQKVRAREVLELEGAKCSW